MGRNRSFGELKQITREVRNDLRDCGLSKKLTRGFVESEFRSDCSFKMLMGTVLGTVLGGTAYAGLSVTGNVPSVTGELSNYLGINLPALVPQTVDLLAGSFIIYVPMVRNLLDYGLTFNGYSRNFLSKTAENERARKKALTLPQDENKYNPENLLNLIV